LQQSESVKDSHLRNSILRDLTEGIEVGHNQHNLALHANSLLSGMRSLLFFLCRVLIMFGTVMGMTN